MAKRMLDCTASDLRNFTKKDYLSSIAASEGRVIACESIGITMPMLVDVTNAEFAASMGADILLLNMFDVDKPVINGLPKVLPEDTVRELPARCPDTSAGRSCRCREKVYARTAIPAGTYKVTMQYSPRFRRVLPYLHDVLHFLGILIHSGNTEEDSAVCIIVGKNTVKGKVTESRKTSDALNALLAKASDIEIEIVEAWR